MIDNCQFIPARELGTIGETIVEMKASQIAVLGDSNTIEKCLPLLLEYNTEELADIRVIGIDPGEGNKNLGIYEHVCDCLLDFEFERSALLINLGGGVITDLGGFVATTFKRGIRFIHIPTTLLGMVDAAIGGKNGVNLKSAKNQLGSFRTPDHNFICPVFLDTLNKAEIESGLAEMLKHGLIKDRDHWDEVSKDNDEYPPIDLIKRSIEIKGGVVKQDPYEHGQRKLLNFGHTIGHAVESTLLEQDLEEVRHGHCIALGMILEARISLNQKRLTAEAFDEIDGVIRRKVKLPKLGPEDPMKIIDNMIYDKKIKGGEHHFTLLDSIGSAQVDQVVSNEEVEQAIQWYRNYS